MTIKIQFTPLGSILLSRYSLIIFQYDDLVEVFTDKLVAKIPSTHGGTVKTVEFVTDDVCLVGHTLLTIEADPEEG